MSELREIVRNYLITVWRNREPAKGLLPFYKIDEMISQVEAWHKSERKKWAMGLLPKEEDDSADKHPEILKTVLIGIRIRNGVIAEIRKKIEEGK